MITYIFEIPKILFLKTKVLKYHQKFNEKKLNYVMVYNN